MSDNNYHLSKEQQHQRPNQMSNQLYSHNYTDIFALNNTPIGSPSTISSPISPMAASLYHQQSLVGAGNFDLGFNNYYYDAPQPQDWVLPQQSVQFSVDNTVPDFLFEPPTTSQHHQTVPDFTSELFPHNTNIPTDYLSDSSMYFDSTSGGDQQIKDKASATNNYRYPTFVSASVSPYERPMTSPVLQNKRKRRASTTASWQPNMSSRSPAESSRNQSKKVKIDGLQDTAPEGPSTVGQLETELAFLRDDCATILIMLDSLRNAFSATNKVSSMGTSVIDFSTNDKRRARVTARNPDMEKEMRIAYDDLMLQVRQLERKVERLEDKRKSMYLENKIQLEKKKDDKMPKLGSIEEEGSSNSSRMQ